MLIMSMLVSAAKLPWLQRHKWWAAQGVSLSFVGDDLNKTMTVRHIDLKANTLLSVLSCVLSTETDAIASVPGFTYMQPLAFFPTLQDTAATRIFVSCIVCHRRKPLSFPRQYLHVFPTVITLNGKKYTETVQGYLGKVGRLLVAFDGFTWV